MSISQRIVEIWWNFAKFSRILRRGVKTPRVPLGWAETPQIPWNHSNFEPCHGDHFLHRLQRSSGINGCAQRWTKFIVHGARGVPKRQFGLPEARNWGAPRIPFLTLRKHDPEVSAWAAAPCIPLGIQGAATLFFKVGNRGRLLDLFR